MKGNHLVEVLGGTALVFAQYAAPAANSQVAQPARPIVLTWRLTASFTSSVSGKSYKVALSQTFEVSADSAARLQGMNDGAGLVIPLRGGYGEAAIMGPRGLRPGERLVEIYFGEWGEDPRVTAIPEDDAGCLMLETLDPKRLFISYEELRNLHKFEYRDSSKTYGCDGNAVLEIRAAGVLEEVEAEPGGPYTVVRGERLELDGSRSKGNIVKYEWTFAPKGCPQGLSGDTKSRKEGVEASVVLLCDTDATLTVSDGRSQDSKTVAVAVKPRDWETPFTHSSVEGKLPPGGSRLPLVSIGRDRPLQGGENVCALEPYNETEPTHVLHPKANSGSWENEGYVLQPVNDPKGPFDGWWYISDYKLKVERQALINPYLVPGGSPPLSGAERFYDANKRLGTDVDGYLGGIRGHEGLDNAKGVLGHSGRMKKALATHDPGRKVEEKFRKGRDELKKMVDEEIQKAERALCDQAKDPLDLIWRGKLGFAEDDTGKYRILAGELVVGGPGYGTTSCR